jgi:hypothetical protein
MMTVDDALKLAEDVESHGEKRSNSLSGQALAALAGEVRRLRADVEPTEEMINVGLRWVGGWQHMRMTDKRLNLAEAFKAMCKIKTKGEL